MAPKYDVFISHAGEDKAPLAVLIYDGLKRRGISAFLDEKELRVAGDAVDDMDDAMRTALVGLFILSPEFALKEYPMLELECFLERVGLLGEGKKGPRAVCPDLIPVFYRLSVAACKYEAAFEDSKCDQVVRARFDERVNRGQTSMEQVLDRLTLLARRTGVENKTEIGNDDTKEMKKRRLELAETICDKVTMVLMHKAQESRLDAGRERPEEGLHAVFEAPENPKEVILDFSSASEDGRATRCEAEVLREVLRNAGGKKSIALIGGGGVGKSCILRGVARHDGVKERFPGGVYFVSMGMDASTDTLKSELLRLLRKSGGKRKAEELQDERSVHEVLGEVRKLIGRERSLVMLDDVWERNGIKAKIVSDVSSMFSNEHGGTLLFTTRSTSVASMGDVAVHIEPREAVSELTMNILLTYAKFTADQIEEEGVTWAVEKLQMISRGLPVCLAVIGRGVGRLRVRFKAEAWVIYLKKINSADAVLRGDVDDYVGLNTSLPIALLVLEENEKTSIEGWMYSWSELYRSLCTMKKQSIMPACALQKMWKLRCAGEVLTAAEGFSSVGLVEIVWENGEFKGVKVHDLLHDFAVSLAKNEKEVMLWHKRVLEGYISTESDDVRAWWGLKDDGYIYENVCRHLGESGSIGELVGVLLNAAWTYCRLERGGLLAWKEDFTHCLTAMKEEGENERIEEERRGLCLVRDAVVESWPLIVANGQQLGFQIHGRLQETKTWPVQKFLESVREWQRGLWLRPDRECWPQPRKGSSWEIVLKDDELSAVALYGEPPCGVLGTRTGDLLVVNLEEKRVVKRLAGHRRWVKQVAIVNDESHIVSFSWDGTVRRWNVETGFEVGCAVLANVDSSDSNNPVRRGQTSPFGRTGTKIAPFLHSLMTSRPRISYSCTVGFSQDCTTLVSGSTNREVHLWDVETGKTVGDAMRGFECDVSCVAISPNGSCVFAGGRDGSLRMWDCSRHTQQLWNVQSGHERGVCFVAFSPNGELVISGGDDTLRLWNASTGKQTGNPLKGHGYTFWCATFCPNGKTIVSGCDDCTVRVWDLGTGEQVGIPLRGHFAYVRAVSASKNGRFAVSLDGAGCAQVWDLQDVTRRNDLCFTKDPPVYYLAASLDKNFFVSVHGYQPVHGVCTMRIWDARSGIQVGPPLHARGMNVICVAIDPESWYLACGMKDGTMRIWDIASRAHVGNELRGHTDMVNSLVYSKDGRWIVSGSCDHTARVWSVESDAMVSRVRRTVAKRHEGSNLDIADGTNTANEMVFSHNNWVTCVAFSEDGKMIFSGIRTGEIFVWETGNGKMVAQFDSKLVDPVRFDIEKEYVRSLDGRGHEFKWRLDSGGVFVEVSDEVDGNRSGSHEGEEDAVIPRADPISCVHRFIQLGTGRRIIATLPAAVFPKAWYYDFFRGVLVTGLRDGQVLFSRVVCGREVA